jgi:universal stress protein family protein
MFHGRSMPAAYFARRKMKPLDPTDRVAPKRILFATDFSTASEAALPHALNIAAHYGSMLYIAHVICPEFRDLLPAESTATIIQQARGLTEEKLGPLPALDQGGCDLGRSSGYDPAKRHRSDRGGDSRTSRPA